MTSVTYSSNASRMLYGLLRLILKANPELFIECAALSEASDAPAIVFTVIEENLVWCIPASYVTHRTLKQVFSSRDKNQGILGLS